jgi:hypothetical protein
VRLHHRVVVLPDEVEGAVDLHDPDRTKAGSGPEPAPSGAPSRIDGSTDLGVS